MLREGVINLVKPAGMTSHNAVSMLRKVAGMKRIGHTGTLDPMAAGVLPLCMGSAARITEYLDLDEKQYRCEMLLGVATDTLDIWGAPVFCHRERVKALAESDVLEAFKPLRGNVMQLPPKYSALKVDGKRLYEYARKGQEVEIKKRPASISFLEIVDMDLKRGRITFDATCSKGTYIRSICRDVGEALGCGGVMSFLLRRSSGCFTLENGVTIEQLKENPQSLEQCCIPTGQALSHLGRLDLRRGRGRWFSNGGYLVPEDGAVTELPFSRRRQDCPADFSQRLRHLGIRESLLQAYRVYEDGVFLGVAVYQEEEKKYICDKVFGK